MIEEAAMLRLLADDVSADPPGGGPGLGVEPAKAVAALADGDAACNPEAGHLLTMLPFELRSKVFERVLRMSGGRSEARGSDILVHHASSFRVSMGGETLIGRLIGIPVLYMEGTIDDRASIAGGDGSTSIPVVDDAFDVMVGRSPHSGIGHVHVLPMLADDGYTQPGGVGELLVAARAPIESAIAAARNGAAKPRLKLAPNVKPGSLARRLGSSQPHQSRWYRDHAACDDRVVGAVALAVVLTKDPVDIGRQCGGVLTPSERHPGIWFGAAQPFVHAVSDLMALGLRAKLRRRCDLDPFVASDGETLHVCDRNGEAYLGRDSFYALECSGGAVATSPCIGHHLAWYGHSFTQALALAVAARIEHRDVATMPVRRAAGAPDPRAATEDDLAQDAVRRKLGFGRLAEAFERIYRERERERADPIEGRPLKSYLKAPVLWADGSNMPTRPTTIAGVVETISRQVSSEMLRIVGDQHADDARRGGLAKAWARRVGEVPLMMVLIDDQFDSGLLKSQENVLDQDDDSGSRKIVLDAGDGYRASLNYGAAQPGSEDLAFKSYFADLLSAEGDLISALTITVVRKRRKTYALTRQDFLYDMDSQSDELMSLGVRLLEVAGDAESLFEQGAVVMLRWLATRDDMRRQGHATRLLDVVLAEIKRDRHGIGTLVVPLSALNMRVTPSANAPDDLLDVYKALTLPVRTMFGGPNRFAAWFGGTAPVLCFDEGLRMTDVEFAVWAGDAGQESR